jgi:hypothetical protein
MVELIVRILGSTHFHVVHLVLWIAALIEARSMKQYNKQQAAQGARGGGGQWK